MFTNAVLGLSVVTWTLPRSCKARAARIAKLFILLESLVCMKVKALSPESLNNQSLTVFEFLKG